MKFRLSLLVVSACLAFTDRSDAAGFDCATARTDDEKLICADPVLSSLDSQLSQNYSRALLELSAAEKVSLKSDQRYWLRKLHAICGGDSAHPDDANHECFKVEYRRRIASLVDPKGSSVLHLRDSDYCPADGPVGKREISWANNPTKNSSDTEQTASIDLPEWGGRRLVSIKTIFSGHESDQTIVIGKLGSSVIDPDEYLTSINKFPKYFFGGDSYDFEITDKGSYVIASSNDYGGAVDNPIVGTIYLKVLDSRLEPVCISARPIIPVPSF